MPRVTAIALVLAACAHPPVVRDAPAKQAPPLVDVQLFDAETGAVVEGAEVHVIAIDGSWKDWMWGDASLDDFARVDTLLEGSASVARSDARGIARIAEPRSYCLLVARAPGRLGLGWLQAGRRVADDIELHRDFDLRARVVDGGGNAVPGVPAVLRVTQEGVVRDVLEARTGEDGIATLRHASVALDASIVRDGARWSLALASCIDPPVETPVEVLDSGALHELVQPDVGNLEVRVEDVDGVPAPDGVEVALVARARDGREPATRERAESRIHSAVHPEFGGRERAAGVMRATTQGGLARFHGVGLGLEFWVGASRHACSAAAFTNGQGPRDEGETTRIVLRFGEERLVVRGRILDVVGKPLADRAVFSSFHMRPPRGGWSHPQRLHVLPPMQVASALRAHEVLGHGEPRTAADGRYSADCGWHGLPGGTLVWVVQCCAGTPDHALAEVAIPAPNERGIVEVGDVRLTPAPVILEGRVVDELGAPVVSVTIHPGGDDEAMNQSLAVDEHGRFMLRGFALAPEVGALAVDVRFGAERSGMRKVGARDVEIVLRRTGEIVGRILPPPPASEAAWIARIVREDTLRDPRGVPDQHPVDPHGRVHFVWREPGLYRLELLRGSPPVVVASRGGLRVEPDQLLDVGTIEIDPK